MVCAAGFYRDSANSCAACATSSTLKGSSWTSAAAENAVTVTAAASIIN